MKKFTVDFELICTMSCEVEAENAHEAKLAIKESFIDVEIFDAAKSDCTSHEMNDIDVEEIVEPQTT